MPCVYSSPVGSSFLPRTGPSEMQKHCASRDASPCWGQSKKLTKEQFQPIIDRIADQLPGWKADLMTRAGRVVQVQFVMTAMLVYVAMAAELPPWAIKAIDKIRRGFLWRGRKDAKGGHCLIAWPKICRHLELGGAGNFRS